MRLPDPTRPPTILAESTYCCTQSPHVGCWYDNDICLLDWIGFVNDKENTK